MQLLPSPSCFTGRKRELAHLDRLRESGSANESVTVIVISGTPGVGKTALGLHWLHSRRTDFPDVQLYVNLRGHDSDGPASPADVLEQFLIAVGVPADQVPAELAARAALFRSATTEKPVLAMLDNAVSAAQVRPLLPGHPTSLVVVTSRQRLAGLSFDGARFVQLTPLVQDAAVDLLEQTLGDDRVAQERESASRLAHLCGRLPIALRVAAARLAVRPHWSIGRAVDDLVREQHRLAALAMEDDISVSAAFDLSHQALPPDAARLYALLGLHPGPDFDSLAAAALDGSEPDHTEHALGILVDANLLEDLTNDRYRFHDLIALHARRQAETNPHERDEAICRMLDWYLYTVDEADRCVMPARPRQTREYERAPTSTMSFENDAAALRWLEAERTNITAVLRYAAETGRHRAAWQLTDALWSLFVFRKHYSDWIESHERGVASARACGDTYATTMLLNHLGLGYHDVGRYTEAVRCFEESLDIYRRLGDRYGQATELNGIGMSLRRFGRTNEAVEHLTEAREIFIGLGERRSEALVRINLGDAYADLGDDTRAAENLGVAVAAMAAVSDQHNEARALQRLARVQARAGQAPQARRELEKALATLRQMGARLAEAEVLEAIGDTSRDTGDQAEAVRYYEQALEILVDLGAPSQTALRARLATLA